MNAVPYSKSSRVIFDSFVENENYEFHSFTNEVRKELRSNTEFSKKIKDILSNENRLFDREDEKRIWLQALKKSRTSEYLFLNLNHFKKNNFELLLECIEELEYTCRIVLNLFLSENKVENIAISFFKNHGSQSMIREKEFVNFFLKKERERLKLLDNIKGLVRVINIDSDCSKSELNRRVWEALNS